MGSRKVNTEGIDEELLLASIGRRTQDGTLRPAQEVPAAAPTGFQQIYRRKYILLIRLCHSRSHLLCNP